MTHSPAGSSAPHIPVMLAEVLEALSVRDGGTYVDGTFGAGGYSRGILERADCSVFGIDRDPDALAMGSPLVDEFEGRLKLLEGRFSQMAELVGVEGVSKVDGIVLDIGVSSMQLDRAERGFSFMSDGPLNMRMDQGAGDDGATAADVVNTCPEGELATILWRLGEEKKSRRIARAIVDARAARTIETTGQLAEIVERAAGGGHQKIHPATRTFQALRIYVNRELEELAYGLAAAEHLLTEGGRLAVVSFHSLEDRIVKSFFRLRSGGTPRPSRHVPVVADDREASSFRMVHRGAVAPGRQEVELNPRSRSAKLRVGERTDAQPLPLDFKAMSVPAIGGA